MLAMLWCSRDLGTRCVCDMESPRRGHTHTGHTQILLQHSFNASREKDDQLLGRRPRTQETRSLNRPQEGLETYFTLTGCSLSAQMTPRDRQGTRNGKIPQHMRRLLVYQLEHRISAPSCNGDCKGGSSQKHFEKIWTRWSTGYPMSVKLVCIHCRRHASVNPEHAAQSMNAV